MKIGIYGGTFDPIHYGHIKLVQKALKEFELDFVYMVPSGNSYMKSNVLDSSKRLEMVNLAVSGIDNICVSEIEILRTGPSYSYETIMEIHEMHPEAELFFLMGEDSLQMIEQWKNPDIILKLSNLIVASRNRLISVNDLLILSERLEEKFGGKIFCMNFYEDISSSDIRKRVQNHESINGLVPPQVEAYIIRENLYL